MGFFLCLDIGVRGQEHSPIRIRAQRGFCFKGTTYSNGIVTKNRAWVNEYYTTQSRYTVPIMQGLATHEMGHALGLEHNDVDASVMRSYTFYTNGTLARTSSSPSTEDKKTMKDIYGYIISLSEENPTAVISEDNPSIPVVAFSPSWAFGYTDYESLANDVDLIVEGQVVQENGVKKDWGNAPESYKTESVFNVENVLKGDSSLKNNNINVLQLGGSDQDAIVISNDTTPLKNGDKSILFLKKNDDGTYRVVNEDTSIFINVTDQNLLKTENNEVYQNQKTKTLISKDDLQSKIK